MSTRVWHRIMISVLFLGLSSLSALAQTMGPLANTTVGNARLIVPDGSSVRQSIGPAETRWFVFGAEPGKTYVMEAVDPHSDLVSDTIESLKVYSANGTTTPPAETNVDCTASTRAPALEVPVAVEKRLGPPPCGVTESGKRLIAPAPSCRSHSDIIANPIDLLNSRAGLPSVVSRIDYMVMHHASPAPAVPSSEAKGPLH